MSAERAYPVVSRWVHSIQLELPYVAEDVDQVQRLAEALIVRHPEIDGHREVWSVVDAVDRWGVERRHRFVHPAVDEPELKEKVLAPVREWHDPLLTVADAAKRRGLSQRTVQRWIEKDELAVITRSQGPNGSTHKWVRASEVDALAKRKEAEQHSGGKGKPRLDTQAVT